MEYVPSPPPLPISQKCLRQTTNVTIRQSLKNRASSLVWARHQSHKCQIMVVVDGGRWKLAVLSSNVTQKGRGASGSSVDPPPDYLAIFHWRPTDHWVFSGLVGPNRSQPYALSAPHYHLAALELQTWQLAAGSRNAAGDTAGSDAASRQMKRAGS